ncbi:MAG: response regulator transcription factor [Syntrophobacterales bacterium]|jgi:DNA-binding NarL/FixJ family response regulator|nr:response regulator transcription factor [Syntrophobacterales bacterium]
MVQVIRELVAGTSDLEILGEANDGQGLLELVEPRKPDLIILDIFLPHIHGLEVTKIIKANYPHIKIMILTKESDLECFFHAIYYGADGYLLEEDVESTLSTAIDTIMKGKTFISPSLHRHLPEVNVKEYVNQDGYFRPLSQRLSDREKEILTLISKGNSNQEIAFLLNISIKTIHNHRAKIMKKLHCRHSTDLVRYAIQKLPLFLDFPTGGLNRTSA